MCVPGLDPVTAALISAATTAAGTGISAMGAQRNADAQNAAIQAQNEQNKRVMIENNRARDEEAVRQASMERQQAEEVTRALMKANPEEAVMRAQARASAPENPITSAPDYNTEGPAPVANQVVDNATAGYEGESAARQEKMLAALAMMTALGNDFAGVGDTIQQSGSNIATVGQHRRGSLSANQAETSIAPGEVTARPGMAGDLMMIGGQALANYGGQQMGKAGGMGAIGDIIMGVGKPKHPAKPILQHGGVY